ncbi:hypothetical protein BDF20DRAFT_876306 [Mycotypha africana]|uniref:uncharacterized protein n=1 Tax=Mycotypha africana TaxID=64632 RepID=UPI002301ECF9|nr:uncharacterized protein BDF20DRAFT_876306 [Mycotypha africana]KAI8977683.1 hypothetical protein BDF20DRAFT_876306 [Mycotypha africana]
MEGKFLDENGQEFCKFIVPTEYCPGVDLISKIVLSDSRIVNAITISIVKAEKDSYVAELLGFMHQNYGAVLYTPHNFETDLPPIVINIIDTFEEKKFNQIIQQCTNIFEQYNTLPICVIIVVQQLDEKIIEQSSQHHDLPLLREIPCAFWAKQCIIMSSKDIKLNKSEVKHHPLLDIIIAITSNEKVILCNDSL